MNNNNAISTRRNISKTFVNKYFELLEWMKTYSNNNRQFDHFILKNQMLRRANSSLFVKVWYEHIACKYYEQIMDEDIGYFLSHNFNDEIKKSSLTEYNVNQAIQYMKMMYGGMDDNIVKLFASRIKELTMLSYIYNKSQ
jgi:hypothetical protein